MKCLYYTVSYKTIGSSTGVALKTVKERYPAM